MYGRHVEMRRVHLFNPGRSSGKSPTGSIFVSFPPYYSLPSHLTCCALAPLNNRSMHCLSISRGCHNEYVTWTICGVSSWYDHRSRRAGWWRKYSISLNWAVREPGNWRRPRQKWRGATTALHTVGETPCALLFIGVVVALRMVTHRYRAGVRADLWVTWFQSRASGRFQRQSDAVRYIAANWRSNFFPEITGSDTMFPRSIPFWRTSHYKEYSLVKIYD